MTVNYTIQILMGLPGSGKSTYAKKHLTRYKEMTRDVLVDLDSVIGAFENDWYNAAFDALYNRDLNKPDQMLCEFYDYNIVFDGTIVNKSQVAAIKTACENYFERYSHYQYKLNFVLHIWEEDRLECLNNDAHRVALDKFAVSLADTIKTTKYENNFVEGEYGFDNIIWHPVYHYDEFDEFMDICKSVADWYSLNEDKFTFRSREWSNGGTWCDCWDNTGYIDAESPKEFDEFDKILEKACPNISFMQYKRLKNDSVKLVNYTDRDYYGGSESKSYWECDLKKLFEGIKEIKNNEK